MPFPPRTPRNALPLEVLGTYDPIPKRDSTLSAAAQKPHKDIKLDISRAKYWLGVGAQPSEPARRILAMLGLCERRLFVQEMIERGRGGEREREKGEQGEGF